MGLNATTPRNLSFPVTASQFSTRSGDKEKAALVERLVLGFKEVELEVVGGVAVEIDKSRMCKGASDQRTKQKKAVSQLMRLLLTRDRESSQSQQNNQHTCHRAKIPLSHTVPKPQI